MKRVVACLAAGAALWFYGCGGDDGSPGGTAGTSGSAGSSGTGGGGNAGTGGRGGSGGTMDGSVGSAGTAGAAGGGAGGTAGTGSGGTSGSGGTGGIGGAPGQLYAHLMWTQPDRAVIQTLNATTGAPIEEKTLALPASKGTGWSARDLDVLHDGTRRLLWTRPEQGESILWVLDRAFNLVREVTNTASNPAQGWFTTSYARLADGNARLVWFNATAKNAVSWPLGTGDTLGNDAKKTYTPPTAAGDWVPVAYTSAPDGTARLLWALAASGGSAPTVAQAEIWFLDPLENQSALSVVTHEGGWFARSYHVERGGRVRMLWGNDTTGTALVCTYQSDAQVDSVPTAVGWGDGQCQSFGPRAGFVARSFTREDCAWDDAACAAPCVDDVKLPFHSEPPAKLSETGLYTAIATKTRAPYAKAYQPQYPLWSDGADKERHVYIPKCSKVDTSDIDHWVLPVGTRVWKQFTRDGVLVETRLIHRFGPKVDDWIFAPYQWTGTNATADGNHVPAGVTNANGTTHDIPSEAMCLNCHVKLPERLLSFSAVQLSHSLPGETMASLSAAGVLSHPRSSGVTVPGNDVERAALGYLHSNCGNCHNASFTQTDFKLRLLSTHTTVQATDAFTTGVGRPTTSFNCNGAGTGACERIERGDAANSAVILRMNVRGTAAQMPPIASEVVHAQGVTAVSAWIDAIAP